MWPYRHAGAGRRELARVVLASLAAGARDELEHRRALGQRWRSRRAERRLAELEEALVRLELGLQPVERRPLQTASTEGAAAVLAVVSAAALVAVVAVFGADGALVGALDVAMLLATLAWFTVAVSRRARRNPPREGSPAPAADR